MMPPYTPLMPYSSPYAYHILPNKGAVHSTKTKYDRFGEKAYVLSFLTVVLD